MVKPNTYVLGGKPEIIITPEDLDGNFFIPTEVRLSIQAPSGSIFTVSGADLTVASGYLYYRYHPDTVGWHETEAWVKDGFGREDVAPGGFEVVDAVY